MFKNENKLAIPILGVIYVIAIIIALIDYLLKETSFGALTFISWIVIIAGTVAFILSVFKVI